MTFCPDNSVLKEFASVCIADWRYWLGMIVCFHFWAYLCRLHNVFKRNSNLSGKVPSFLLSKKCEHTVETKLHIKLCCVRVPTMCHYKACSGLARCRFGISWEREISLSWIERLFYAAHSSSRNQRTKQAVFGTHRTKPSNKNTRPFCIVHGHPQISIQGQAMQDCLKLRPNRLSYINIESVGQCDKCEGRKLGEFKKTRPILR